MKLPDALTAGVSLADVLLGVMSYMSNRRSDLGSCAKCWLSHFQLLGSLSRSIYFESAQIGQPQ